MRIMIVGCCGYIGSILTQYFAYRPYTEVIGVDNLHYGNGQCLSHLIGLQNFQFQKMNLGDLAHSSSIKLSSVDCFVILSGLVGEPICTKNPDLSKSCNVDQIKNFVGKVSKSQRVLFPCTNSGYGRGENFMCDENSPLKPVSIYGIHKVEGEKIVLGHENSVSLRLATAFGVSPCMRFDLLVNDFVNQLYKTGSLTIYEPHYRRNAVHIRDISRAFLWLMDPQYTGVYNVGNPECNLTKMQFAEKICTYIGFRPDKCIKVGEGKDPDQRDYVVSNQKLLNTGFKFKYNLENSVHEILNWCKLIHNNGTYTIRNL